MRTAKITLAIVAIAILTGYAVLAFNSGVAAQKLKFSVPTLQSTETKLKSVNVQYEKLNTQLKTQSSTDQERIQQLNTEKAKLQQQQQSLQKQLQSKAEEKTKLSQVAAATAATVTNTVTVTTPVAADPLPTLPSGSHTDWMAEAGISPSDYGYVEYIVDHEGSWNPCVINGGAVDCSYATNGGQRAYGVCQALPGSKMAVAGADWATNPVTQLRWCAMYASYAHNGGWYNCYLFWVNNRYW